MIPSKADPWNVLQEEGAGIHSQLCPRLPPQEWSRMKLCTLMSLKKGPQSSPLRKTVAMALPTPRAQAIVGSPSYPTAGSPR